MRVCAREVRGRGGRCDGSTALHERTFSPLRSGAQFVHIWCGGWVHSHSMASPAATDTGTDTHIGTGTGTQAHTHNTVSRVAVSYNAVSYTRTRRVGGRLGWQADSREVLGCAAKVDGRGGWPRAGASARTRTTTSARSRGGLSSLCSRHDAAVLHDEPTRCGEGRAACGAACGG